ncbi:MAG: hypothetical protein KME43_16525 [Myxacorys chilensis ATA2-1-KO14]|jgi:hypothetical protein|nr:hypothetical protein [Myxacorys chilensis ATA2-1-KO14]
MFSTEDLQVFEMPLGWERNDALGKIFHPKLAAIQLKINELIRQVYGIEVHRKYKTSFLPTSSENSGGYTGDKRRSDRPYNPSKNVPDASCAVLRGSGNAAIPKARGGFAKQHFGIFGAYLSDFGDDGVLVGAMLMPYVYYRYTQEIRDAFVSAAKQLELFELLTGYCDHFNSPDCPIEEAFYTDRAWAFLNPNNALEATSEDYAWLTISSAAAFPLFDVFTRLCSNPKLSLQQDYCSLFYSWYDNHVEDYISQFSIESISDESIWKSETETRRIFEELCNAKFPKSRPSWLKSNKGTSLELDGYNQDLKIAFEYQGEYHYMEVPIHQQRRTLVEIQRTDQLKEDLCQRYGVTLIQVPYWEKGSKQFIIERLQAVGKLSA